MDCSPPGPSVHGILQARILECVAIPHPFLQGIFLTQGLNLGLLLCRQTLYHLSHQGSPGKKTVIPNRQDDYKIRGSVYKCNISYYLLKHIDAGKEAFAPSFL